MSIGKHKKDVSQVTQPEKVENTTLLPVIDISFLTNSYSYSSHSTDEYQSCINEIRKACEETGFFLIKGHSISRQAIFDLQMSARRFFSLSEKEKLNYLIGSNGSHCGYVPFSESGQYDDEGITRLYEAFDLSLDLDQSDPDYLNGHLFYGPNIWPDIPYFKKRVQHYFEKVSTLSLQLVAAFEAILEMPAGTISSKMTKPTSQLRLIHYIADEANRVKMAGQNIMGAHTDYELFTLLFSDNSGLQTKNMRGHWVDVPLIEDTFTVNIGDMLEVFSNGRFKSNIHRVSNLGVERYSFPFFTALDYNAIVEPWLKHQENPLYQTVVAGEHLATQVISDFAYLRNKNSEKKTRNNPFENTYKNKVDKD
ncbi:MAG: isopenicillin N synthase family dioxygenase [Kangiellaceae bacterium]